MIEASRAWEKAAACEAHARATSDVEMQAKFRKLRDSWIRIGNQAELRAFVARKPPPEQRTGVTRPALPSAS